MTVTARQGQTLLDISIQHLGDESGVAALAQANGLDMTAALEVNQVLVLPTVVNKRVAKVFSEDGFRPATQITGEGEGIEYWGIEFDFIVS